MTKRNQKKLAKFIVAFVLALVGFYMQMEQPNSAISAELAEPGYYEVLSIADGDTITVDMEGKKEKIRFIGVDTPEVHHGGSTPPSQCYADKAKTFTETSIDGKRVKLVADEKGSNRDRYGRLLRYVYNYQNVSIDQQLVSEGYGFAVNGFSYTKKADYLKLMDDAKLGKKGLWAICKIDEIKGYPQIAE